MLGGLIVDIFVYFLYIRCVCRNCIEIRPHLVSYHDLLLQRLQIYFGLSNASLEWIRSFLSDRTYQLADGVAVWCTARTSTGSTVVCSLHSRGVSRGGASQYALTSVGR